MYGPGANSDSGLVGNITLDEQNLSAQPTEGLAKVNLTYNIANMGWAGTGQPTEDLTKAGMGSLVLNGSNIFTANTTINFGTLQLRNGEGIVGHGDHNVTLFTDNNSQAGGDWAFNAGNQTSTGTAFTGCVQEATRRSHTTRRPWKSAMQAIQEKWTRIA